MAIGKIIYVPGDQGGWESVQSSAVLLPRLTHNRPVGVAHLLGAVAEDRLLRTVGEGDLLHTVRIVFLYLPSVELEQLEAVREGGLRRLSGLVVVHNRTVCQAFFPVAVGEDHRRRPERMPGRHSFRSPLGKIT